MSGNVELILRDSTGAEGPVRRTGNALYATLAQLLAGERNAGSASNSYLVTHEETDYTLFAPGGTSETIILPSACYVYGFLGNTGTGTLTLRDSASAAGATSPFAAFTLAVGTLVTLAPGGRAIRFNNGLTAQLGTGTDKVVIFYRAQ